MPSTCVSAARRRCLLWVPLLTLALSFTWHLSAQGAQQRIALAGSAQALAHLQALDQQARTLQANADPAAAPAQTLPVVLAEVLDLLRAGDAQHGVRAGLLSLPGQAGGVVDGPPDAQDLLALSHPLAGVPGLRSVHLDVRATYRTYAGLRAWCEALEHLPLVVRHLALEDSQIQLDLLVLGR